MDMIFRSKSTQVWSLYKSGHTKLRLKSFPKRHFYRMESSIFFPIREISKPREYFLSTSHMLSLQMHAQCSVLYNVIWTRLIFRFRYFKCFNLCIYKLPHQLYDDEYSNSRHKFLSWPRKIRVVYKILYRTPYSVVLPPIKNNCRGFSTKFVLR
jgi:hypothetical protein